MIFPAEPVRKTLAELFVEEYERVVVYADAEEETVLHEGAATIRANGWIELPSGRLLSPAAVHHVETGPTT